MLGLIKGLFAGKKQEQVEAEQVQQAVKKQKKENAFFLDPDSAKTFGDIEYMRTAKTVRRTFPKTASNKGEFEVEQTVSAMAIMKEQIESGKAEVKPMSEAAATEVMKPTINSNAEVEERRRTDTSMDMFRNMAKDIKR